MDDKARAVAAQLPRLRRYAIALLGDRADADDLVQETLERALTRLHLWQPETDMRAWLFTIMHNLHVNRVRKERREGNRIGMDDILDHLSSPPEQHNHMLLKAFVRALGKLPAEQRHVILLIGLEGMSYKDAAEVTGVPVGTIMSRLARGRHALRLLVDGEEVTRNVRIVK